MQRREFLGAAAGSALLPTIAGASSVEPPIPDVEDVGSAMPIVHREMMHELIVAYMEDQGDKSNLDRLASALVRTGPLLWHSTLWSATGPENGDEPYIQTTYLLGLEYRFQYVVGGGKSPFDEEYYRWRLTRGFDPGGFDSRYPNDRDRRLRYLFGFNLARCTPIPGGSTYYGQERHLWTEGELHHHNVGKYGVIPSFSKVTPTAMGTSKVQAR